MDIYLLWRFKVITADHDGYCSGRTNQEEISYQNIFYSYNLNKKEATALIWIYKHYENDIKMNSVLFILNSIINIIDIKMNSTLFILNLIINIIDINDPLFIEATIPTKMISHIETYGSGYCDASIIHGLRHEKLKEPLDIIDIRNVRPSFKKNKKIKMRDSFSLSWILKPIIEINDTITVCLLKTLPMDMIKLILIELLKINY